MVDPADASGYTIRDTGGMSIAVLESILGDCINKEELHLLLNKNPSPVCYVWFVPSPSMHITQGISKTMYVNNMVKAGCTVKILIADWFAQMDNKIGSDLNKIRTIGYYNIEVWKAVGMDLGSVEFVWLSDVMNCHAASIWPLVMDIGQKITLGGMKRCCRTTAPYGLATLQATELLLPWLQCATILFHKEEDIWLFDVDQREVSILARKYCQDIKRGNVPMILFNNMLPDLLKDPGLAECSDPTRAISMEDDEEFVDYKIMVRAFCPPKVDKGNPCLEYVKYVIFPWFGKFEVVQERDNEKRTFTSMEKLIADYKRGALHSTDVKLALKTAINKMLQPYRDHFQSNIHAKDLWQTIEAILYGD